jgi:hypothetical protein
MIDRIQSHTGQIVGSAVSSGGTITAITAWQSQLAWGVTITAGVVAIVSGLLTIRSILRRDVASK